MNLSPQQAERFGRCLADIKRNAFDAFIADREDYTSLDKLKGDFWEAVGGLQYLIGVQLSNASRAAFEEAISENDRPARMCRQKGSAK